METKNEIKTCQKIDGNAKIKGQNANVLPHDGCQKCTHKIVHFYESLQSRTLKNEVSKINP